MYLSRFGLRTCIPLPDLARLLHRVSESHLDHTRAHLFTRSTILRRGSRFPSAALARARSDLKRGGSLVTRLVRKALPASAVAARASILTAAGRCQHRTMLCLLSQDRIRTGLDRPGCSKAVVLVRVPRLPGPACPRGLGGVAWLSCSILVI